jgi:hypothetical protein
MSAEDTATRKDTLEALGAYQKRGRIGDDIKKMADLLVDESDRGVVVILGSLIEDILFERLLRSFAPLSVSQKKNLNRGGGLLGSFDHRITLAQALGLIDDDMVGMLQVTKAMRNACAHSRLDITFETPELRNTLALLFDGENAEDIRNANSGLALRTMFIIAYVFMSAILRGYSPEEARERGQRIMDSLLIEASAALVKQRTSREKRTQQRALRLRSHPKDKKR